MAEKRRDNRGNKLNTRNSRMTWNAYTHLTEDKKKEQEAVAQTVRIS